MDLHPNSSLKLKEFGLEERLWVWNLNFEKSLLVCTLPDTSNFQSLGYLVLRRFNSRFFRQSYSNSSSKAKGILNLKKKRPYIEIWHLPLNFETDFLKLETYFSSWPSMETFLGGAETYWGRPCSTNSRVSLDWNFKFSLKLFNGGLDWGNGF